MRNSALWLGLRFMRTVEEQCIWLDLRFMRTVEEQCIMVRHEVHENSMHARTKKMKGKGTEITNSVLKVGIKGYGRVKVIVI